MHRLASTYAGLKLKNPIIISSSGLTNSVDKLIGLEKAGVGAIVLKSLFEEQIVSVSENMLEGTDYPEAVDYIRNYIESHHVNDYLGLIHEAKSHCTVPIIASINCYTSESWLNFASQIEMSGADALEINLFTLETNPLIEGSFHEQAIAILRKLKENLRIPIVVKLSKYHYNIPFIVNKLYQNGASAVVLFNKFYQPDIDIDSMTMTSASIFSSEGSLNDTLRWLGIVSGRVPKIDLSASTGVFSWEDAVKCLLAGADTVQLCSTVYKSGNSIIPQIISGITKWMQQKNFESVDEFRGKLSYSELSNPMVYERSQFMKYFSDNKR